MSPSTPPLFWPRFLWLHPFSSSLLHTLSGSTLCLRTPTSFLVLPLLALPLLLSLAPPPVWSPLPPGPATWVKLGHCNGTRQSPVELSTHDAVPDPRLGPVALSGYGDARRLRSLHNTGHTVDVQLAEGLMLSGPGLPGHYRAQSFHLHWGQGEARPGSEHLLDGRRFSMELHVVHTKENLTLHEAMDDPEGVAVLAFFVQVRPHAWVLRGLGWSWEPGHLGSQGGGMGAAGLDQRAWEPGYLGPLPQFPHL
ncbi:carbonic anhydrase 4-like [Alligator sinensis]|uniref:Carbonic anhydrase n=1 Tax=Alligator sinensis TaxID=38654 RepID=A0A3Q0FUL6_ALLSI|nr:carbonic anhydrase 4-like [Alligator sinensis]